MTFIARQRSCLKTSAHPQKVLWSWHSRVVRWHTRAICGAHVLTENDFAPQGFVRIPQMKYSSQTRILLVDDSSVVRQQLRRLLERHPEWEVCGEAIDGREAIDKVNELKPDLVLLDFAMPVLNGLKSAQSILKQFPGTLILLFTTFLSNQLLDEARNVGIHGALAKGDLVRDLAPGIQSVLRHESFFPTSVPG